MIIKINEEQQKQIHASLLELKQHYAECDKAIVANLRERIAAYEADHGVITPAPKGTRYRKRDGEAALHAYLKRMLLDADSSPMV